MTRSHKINDRDHSAPQTGIIAPNEALPRYFAKSGPVDADPRKTKKDGGGKGNWGRSGEEVRDYEYSFMNARRRSNSSVQGISGFKTKFETIEPEPVFEEDLHGPLDENIIDGPPFVKADSVSSGTSGGGEIEKAADQKSSTMN
ncbi:hypothetical protein ASPVEDRAFT_195669 [Aspergillus versicolor CBS 583.65]|uniref:Hyaluronan/mRNA-binding protein domain-containing protein n=1 Tax=Aspergillus versicolor CBS 583.65 TaxID=1036611 RepID=A0A1L9PQL9_ASPVE|nr:uncharacterized protein ASPVEDRAFT_195669 [Aspergillus versicolor CBS 583.65]OJJ03838.1 hypothetical protein ASPVEDRAFT_195669 [Aspergillus versicolor CBS 583.65]